MAVSNEELKRFLDAKKKRTRLLGDVERYLLKRPAGDRRTDVLHPSEIIKKDFCLRGSYYLLKGYPKLQANPALRMQVIFDEGHYIHAKWQGYFQGMGVLHGKFKCRICNKVTVGTSPKVCDMCGRENSLEYAEVQLTDPALRIAGHTDGWVKNIGPDCLIEIKSIGPGTIRYGNPSLMADANGDILKAWGNINRPFSDHILQGQVYLELMNRMGYTDDEGNPVDEIVFLYELKLDQSYKEFNVKRDYELVRHVFEKAEKVVKAVENNTPPRCNNNAGGTCPQCAPYRDVE
jgi:predicted RNA-binding protein with PUA domain